MPRTDHSPDAGLSAGALCNRAPSNRTLRACLAGRVLGKAGRRTRCKKRRLPWSSRSLFVFEPCIARAWQLADKVWVVREAPRRRQARRGGRCAAAGVQGVYGRWRLFGVPARASFEAPRRRLCALCCRVWRRGFWFAVKAQRPSARHVRRPFRQAAFLTERRRRGPDRRIDPAWRGYSAAGQPGVEV